MGKEGVLLLERFRDGNDTPNGVFFEKSLLPAQPHFFEFHLQGMEIPQQYSSFT